MNNGVGYTTQYERAAIIGYWRSGASIEQMGIAIPYITHESIKRIISKYKNSLKGYKSK